MVHSNLVACNCDNIEGILFDKVNTYSPEKENVLTSRTPSEQSSNDHLNRKFGARNLILNLNRVVQRYEALV